MNYVVRFTFGYASNRCVFDNKEEAMKFAKHIRTLEGVRGISIYSLSYEYELTVEVNK